MDVQLRPHMKTTERHHEGVFTFDLAVDGHE
jgi:hypothetical protein